MAGASASLILSSAQPPVHDRAMPRPGVPTTNYPCPRCHHVNVYERPEAPARQMTHEAVPPPFEGTVECLKCGEIFEGMFTYYRRQTSA